MRSPFDIHSGAFDPFMDTTISIMSEGHSTSVKASLFEENFDTAISDMSPASERRHLSAFIPKQGEGGWNSNTLPKMGDIMIVPSFGGSDIPAEFVVEKVYDFFDTWRLTATEVE